MSTPKLCLRTVQILLGICFLQARPCLSQEATSTFRFSGFGTLGWVRSSAEEAEFSRSLSQLGGAGRNGSLRVDSRLGLQMDLQLISTLRMTAQVLSCQRHDGRFAPDLSWAFLAWQPTEETQVRAGRLGFDVFMNADSRDVGYTMLWVRPPVEVFGTLPLNAFEGLDLSRTFNLSPEIYLYVKAYAGEALGRMPLGDGSIYHLKGSRLAGLLGEVQNPHWRLRAAYARVRFKNDLPGSFVVLQEGLRAFGQQLQDLRPLQAAEDLRLQDRSGRFLSLGMSWESSHAQTTGMVTRYTSDASMSPDSWSGFGSFGWRFGPVVPYVLGSRVVSERPRLDLGSLENLPLPQAQDLVAGVAQALATNQNDQTTLAVGLRWDFSTQACLKTQWEHVRTHNASGLWSGAPVGWKGRSNVFSVTLDFTF